MARIFLNKCISIYIQKVASLKTKTLISMSRLEALLYSLFFLVALFLLYYFVVI